MCGLVGIAALRPVESRDWLVAARDRLAHRGPDDAGIWWARDGRVGLGHRRLAILDLSPGGRQPMQGANGATCIAFNGEIYNFDALRRQLRDLGHAFGTSSDTEVILAAYAEWGESCVERLEGMFAFALFDQAARRVLLARDRVGEKPLFYAATASSLRFASEIKALLADESVPRRLDWYAMDCMLSDGFSPPDATLLVGIRKLPPAHTLSFDVDTGRLELRRYWDLPRLQHASVDEGALLEELERRLESAVRRQLVADVPVGVLLSGGIDSSLVTAMAARVARGVKTFNVRFPGHGSHDETGHARLIARHFSTGHVEIDAGAIDVALLPVLAEQFDEPLIDSSMVPTHLVSRVVREHCTVVLGGDGGDELFGGYPHYDRALRMEAAFAGVPVGVRRLGARAAGEFLPPGFKGRNWAQALDTRFDVEVPIVTQIFDCVTRRRLFSGVSHWQEMGEAARRTLMLDDGDLVQRATRFDFRTYLPEDLLVKVDRASMLNSLEVRAPLLDVSLLEFAFGRVPSNLKVTRTERKILLKRLAARVLPRAFDRVRKQGFSIPLGDWLASGPWLDFFRDVLLDRSVTWCNRQAIRRLMATARSRRANSERLFGLVMFELWRRVYRVEVSQ